jgi:hypothetical protein
MRACGGDLATRFVLIARRIKTHSTVAESRSFVGVARTPQFYLNSASPLDKCLWLPR